MDFFKLRMCCTPQPNHPSNFTFDFDLPQELLSFMVFPSSRSTYDEDSFPDELLWIPSLNDGQGGHGRHGADGLQLPCLLLPRSTARFIILYLHANGEDLGRIHTFCSRMGTHLEVHVCAVEYPGYGICPGGPCTEERQKNAAVSALRFLHEALGWPLDDIIVMGRSIGCCAAIALASEYRVGGLVLVSPMLSLKELSWSVIGPFAEAFGESFNNLSRIGEVKCPVLIVHGQKDNIVPTRHGAELHNACNVVHKLLVCPEELGHNCNLLKDVHYLVMPMVQLFPIPDYCFKELNVPSWAFQRYRELPEQMQVVCDTRGLDHVVDLSSLVQPEAYQERVSDLNNLHEHRHERQVVVDRDQLAEVLL